MIAGGTGITPMWQVANAIFKSMLYHDVMPETSISHCRLFVGQRSVLKLYSGCSASLSCAITQLTERRPRGQDQGHPRIRQPH